MWELQIFGLHTLYRHRDSLRTFILPKMKTPTPPSLSQQKKELLAKGEKLEFYIQEALNSEKQKLVLIKQLGIIEEKHKKEMDELSQECFDVLNCHEVDASEVSEGMTKIWSDDAEKITKKIFPNFTP